MPGRLVISLDARLRAALDDVVRHHRLPYVRERAAAILRIAAGEAGRAVAQRGPLVRRRPETVYRWVHRFLERGIAGLLNQPGRGRKPAFSPSVRDGRASGGNDARHPSSGA